MAWLKKGRGEYIRRFKISMYYGFRLILVQVVHSSVVKIMKQTLICIKATKIPPFQKKSLKLDKKMSFTHRL